MAATSSSIRSAPRLLSHLARAQSLPTAPFTYDLPQGRIAVRPLAQRDASKLLAVTRDAPPHGAVPPVAHHTFADLPALLPPGALLVRNATRVIRARVPLAKATGGRAEALLLHPLPPSGSAEPAGVVDPNAARSVAAADALDAHPQGQRWAALLSGRNLKVGDTLYSTPESVPTFSPSSSASAAAGVATATGAHAPRLGVTIEQKGPIPHIRLSCPPPTTTTQPSSSTPPTPTSATTTAPAVGNTVTPTLRATLDILAQPPLPPYIRRTADAADVAAFQTVFATDDGSVAAPTAALHVTDDVMRACDARDVRVANVVLHIGTATFRPVAADQAGGHDMHCEAIAIEETELATIAEQTARGGPIVALGTTSVRTIESLYWFGVQLLLERPGPTTARLKVSQWEPYRRMDQVGGEDRLPPSDEALRAVLDHCRRECGGTLFGETSLLVLPSYPFMLTNALITNFHQPNSTLLMLVSAFLGGSTDRLKSVYERALESDYRFLSYGDSSIYADSSFFDASRRLTEPVKNVI